MAARLEGEYSKVCEENGERGIERKQRKRKGREQDEEEPKRTGGWKERGVKSVEVRKKDGEYGRVDNELETEQSKERTPTHRRRSLKAVQQYNDEIGKK